MSAIYNLQLNINRVSMLTLGSYVISLFAFYEYRIVFEFICFIVLFVYTVKEKKGITFFTGWNLAFIAVGLISILSSVNPAGSALMTRKLVELALICYFLISYIDSKEKIISLQKIFVLAGVFLIIRLLIKFPISDWGSGRLGDSILNANTIGLYLSIASVYSFEIAIREKKKKYLLLIPLYFVVIALSGSRKALLMVLSGISGVYLLNSKKLFKKIIAVIISVAIFFISYFLIMNIPDLYQVIGIRFERLINSETVQDVADNSVRTRLELVDRGISLVKTKPIFGYGISTYSYISGFDMYAHNNYIELLVGVGFVGAYVYYFMYAYLLTNMIRNFNKLIRKSFLVILVLLIAMEYALVTYYYEVYQIILATTYICLRVSKKEGRSKIECYK